MLATELVTDGFSRVESLVHRVLDGLTVDQLTHRIDPDANTIAWLVWHLTRIQDDHVAHLAGSEQAWHADSFYDRFGLPYPPEAHGYGHTAADVAAVTTPAGLLREYYDATHARTLAFLATLSEADFARVVDANWDPPVTLAVRIVSVLSDDLQHIGQAALLRGIIERSG